MRILLYGRHRYPARRDDGTGPRPRPDPSGAPHHITDLLARGLAGRGHDVLYLLPAGLDEPLPDGVEHVTDVPAGVDVFHDLRVAGRPWVATVHGYRPPAGYFDRHRGGAIVAEPGRDAEPPYALPANAICVSRSLARRFGGGRHVLNGVDPAELAFAKRKDGYLLFMAGMQGPAYPDMFRRKGLDVALELRRELGFELVVAGTARERAVAERVAAMCRAAGAEYVGDVRGPRKAELLAGARALLFPTRLEEGCPLVIAEALFSGTPVIASDGGACRELIDPDVGFVCADRDAFRDAIAAVGSVSPARCRSRAEERFDYRRMAADYVREYEAEL